MKVNAVLIIYLMYQIKTQFNVEDLSISDKTLFDDFRIKFAKRYSSKDELNFRFQIFLKNLRLLKKEPEFTAPDGTVLLGSSFDSKAKDPTYQKGINEFIDLTDNEFSDSYLLPEDLLYKESSAQKRGLPPVKTQAGRFLQETNPLKDLPRKIDWKEKGKVTPVKFQSRCNSCYAFSANAALESHSLIYNNQQITLSEQELLDCSTKNYGCKGGQPSAAFEYIVDNFLSTDNDYPYIGQVNTECYKDFEVIPDFKGELEKKTATPPVVPAPDNGRKLQEKKQSENDILNTLMDLNNPMFNFQGFPQAKEQKNLDKKNNKEVEKVKVIDKKETKNQDKDNEIMPDQLGLNLNKNSLLQRMNSSPLIQGIVKDLKEIIPGVTKNLGSGLNQDLNNNKNLKDEKNLNQYNPQNFDDELDIYFDQNSKKNVNKVADNKTTQNNIKDKNNQNNSFNEQPINQYNAYNEQPINQYNSYNQQQINQNNAYNHQLINQYNGYNQQSQQNQFNAYGYNQFPQFNQDENINRKRGNRGKFNNNAGFNQNPYNDFFPLNNNRNDQNYQNQNEILNNKDKNKNDKEDEWNNIFNAPLKNKNLLPSNQNLSKIQKIPVVNYNQILKDLSNKDQQNYNQQSYDQYNDSNQVNKIKTLSNNSDQFASNYADYNKFITQNDQFYYNQSTDSVYNQPATSTNNQPINTNNYNQPPTPINKPINNKPVTPTNNQPINTNNYNQPASPANNQPINNTNNYNQPSKSANNQPIKNTNNYNQPASPANNQPINNTNNYNQPAALINQPINNNYNYNQPATPANNQPINNNSNQPATPINQPINNNYNQTNSIPIVKPTTPVIQPLSPVVQPTTPAIQPATPVVQPSTPVVQPTTPIVRPTNPAVQPTTPVITQPTKPIVAPIAEKRKKFKKLKAYQFVNQNIIDLLKAVEKGPLVVAHYASNEFKFYSKGIYNGDGCESVKTVNHATLLVGYDLNAQIPYMLFKNSWGESWGEDGFYKMAIGDLLYTNKGLCLVAGTPFNTIPILE